MFQHDPYVIFSGDLLEHLLSQGCGRAQYVVGYGLIKLVVYNELCLVVLNVEVVDIWRNHTGAWWGQLGKTVEGWSYLLYGSSEVQGNFMIIVIQND